MAIFTPKQALPLSPALMAELMGDVSVQIAHRSVVLAGLKPGSIVLDNACGNGVVTLAIIDTENPSEITIYAADINPKMCEATTAAAASKDWADSVKTAAMPAEALTFDDNFFSHSFTNFLLNAAKEPEMITSNIYRTAKPGGTAIVTTWGSVAHIPAILAANTATRGPDVFHAMKGGKEWNDPAHLEKVLKKTGFLEVKMEQCDSYLKMSDLRRWSLIAWSFSGGMTPGGWTEADEGKFQQAVDTIHDTILKSPGAEPDGKGGVRFKMIANIVVAKK
jgi:ubiquinone/menaquinone biosynthesis C-methylase UbiE